MPPAPDAPARRAPAVALAFVLGPLLAVAALALGHDPREAQDTAPLTHREAGYGGAAGCADCHPDQHASWAATFHRTMTQRPTPDAVLGAFDGRAVEYLGQGGRVLERDGRFLMDLPAPGGGRRVAEVALAVGSRRYQQYFERVDRGDGTFTHLRLPLLWHVGEERWMHVNTVFLEPDSADWSAHRVAWNANCVLCHNTGARPGLAGVPPGGGPNDAHFDTAVADLGIACEACHGPGEAHAERMRAPLARYRAALGGDGADDVVDPKDLGQRESIAVCGQCHGQHRVIDPPRQMPELLATGRSFRPGDRLDEHVQLLQRSTPSPVPGAPHMIRDRFWADGTPRLTAYEAQGHLASPCMADASFTCLSCHDMHGGDPRGMVRPKMRTNRACTQCHAEYAGAGEALAAHTGHAPDGPGSACLDCHMPRVVFGVLELHRSHRIEVPDPAADAEAGRPNACTLCHLDRTPAWAAREMDALWGGERRAPRSRPSGAPADLAAGPALLLAGDPVQRAAGAAAAGRLDGAIAPEDTGFLRALLTLTLGDPYPGIRRIARRSLLALDRQAPLGDVAPLAAWDPQDVDGREAVIEALLRNLHELGPAELAAPAPGLGLRPDFLVDQARVRRLIELQSQRAIAIGE